MTHHFNPEVAVKLGVNAAIIIANLAYLQHNRQAQGGDKYYMDERWWVHHTYDSLQKVHPYFSVQKIRRIMRALVQQGAVFHCTPTKWRRDSYWSVAPDFLHVSESTVASVGIDSSQVSESTVVLHDNNIEHKIYKKVPRLEDFEITDGLREWARAREYKGLNSHAEEFIDYCRSKPKTYKDYEAAFRNWVRRGEKSKVNGGRWS